MYGVHRFRQLAVWLRSISVAEEIYRATSDFPKSERYGLVPQMRRSAVSIASNIAEGSSRATDRDVRRFLAISRGSASELETQVLIANRVGLITDDETVRLTGQIDEVKAMLIGLATNLAPSREA